MELNEIYKVSENLVLAELSDVDGLESALNVALPKGYRESVTELGYGYLSTWIRVYMPNRYREEFKDFQNRLDQYYFWEAGKDILTIEQVIASIFVADTLDGSELYFNPNMKSLFVLPRHSGKIFSVGSDFLEVLEWLFNSGELTAPLVDLYFDLYTQKNKIDLNSTDVEVDFDELREGLLALNVHNFLSDSPPEEDRMFQLFVKSFGGDVSLLEGIDEAPDAQITFEVMDEQSNQCLQQVIDFLVSKGYVRS